MRSFLLAALAAVPLLACSPSAARASWLSEALHRIFDPPYAYYAPYPAPLPGVYAPEYPPVPAGIYYYGPAPRYYRNRWDNWEPCGYRRPAPYRDSWYWRG